MEGVLSLTVWGGIGRSGLAIRPDREPVSPRLLAPAAAQHAQPVVVGVVLHHQDQDVVNLRKSVRTLRPVWKGALTYGPRPHACRLRSHSRPPRHPPWIPSPACSPTLRRPAQQTAAALDRRMRP